MQINLEPLVINIRKLINHNRVVVLKRRSEKSRIVLEDIRRAVITFIDIGEQIAKDIVNGSFESFSIKLADFKSNWELWWEISSYVKECEIVSKDGDLALHQFMEEYEC